MSKDSFKVLVLGASGVGKTTLLEKIVKNKPQKDTEKTIGVSFFLHEVIINDKKYTFQFWDFKADERFEFLYKDYFRGADAAIIIFDWSRIETFYIGQRYLSLIRQLTKPNLHYLLVGNKIDLIGDLKWEGRGFCIEWEEGGFYIDCSIENTEKFEKAIMELMLRIGESEMIEVLAKDINIKILLALNIFPELTLKRLVRLLNKSKPTLSRHTRSLIKTGLVKSYSKENEKQPGSIKKKYYTTNFDLNDDLEDIDINSLDKKSDDEILSLRMQLRKKLHTVMIYELFSKMLQRLTNKFPGGNTTPSVLSSLSETSYFSKFIISFLKTSINLRFLNENQYNKLESLKQEFFMKFNKILEEDDGSKKVYVYVEAILPILQLLEIDEFRYEKDPNDIKNFTDRMNKLSQESKKTNE